MVVPEVSAVTQHRKYDQQPLVEAVFELFAEPDARSSWSSSALAQAKASFAEYQFHEEKLRDVGINLRIKDQAFEPQPIEPRERIRLWDSPRQRAIQFGSHMCAHNVLSPAYTHFVDHRPTIGNAFRFFLEHAKPERLAWIGQRYINFVKLPADEHNVEQYFEIYPRLPESLSGGHRPLAVQIQTVDFKLGTAMVNLSLQSVADDEATYLLDIYARSSGEVPLDVDALLRWQGDAHEAIWQSFQLSVSEKSKKELFKERPWS